jgi:uncharacterized protein with PQ loop repeat
MFTQLLAAIAAVYGVLAALITLLQTRQMLARRSSCDVSARFLASYAGGYGIWLAYGLSTGSIPLIVVDTVGLLCGGLTLAVALSLRGSPSHLEQPRLRSGRPGRLGLGGSGEGRTTGLLLVRPGAGFASSGSRTAWRSHRPRPA